MPVPFSRKPMYLKSISRVVLLAEFILFSMTLAKCDNPVLSNDALEVKEDKYSSYVEELGLKKEDLNWGPSIKQIRIAGMLINPRDSESMKLGKATLIYSIQNQSQSPVIIPLFGGLPLFAFYTFKDTPRKPLFRFNPGFSGEPASAFRLDPGKMITFTMTHKKEWFNKTADPIVLTIDFDGYGITKLPEWENALILESNEIRFPQ